MSVPQNPEQTVTGREIVTQPESWRQAAETFTSLRAPIASPGETVAVVGCGTSCFIARAFASKREAADQGLTDAFAVSQFPTARLGHYDRVIGITRSGTTTELLDLLNRVESPTQAITAVADSPVAEAADSLIPMPFADETSVVQTRFATSALALLRASLGEDLTGAINDATTALSIDVESFVGLEQVTFLGDGWTVGLAEEAALKCREAAQMWTESYPSMEYRHGPKAIGQSGRVVWSLDDPPADLVAEVSGTGAHHINHSELDPMARLIVAQRFAVAESCHRGLNPDAPRNLGRSVVLEASATSQGFGVR